MLRVGTCSNNTKGTFVALLKAAATAFRVGIPPLDGEGDRKRESKLINLKLKIGKEAASSSGDRRERKRSCGSCISWNGLLRRSNPQQNRQRRSRMRLPNGKDRAPAGTSQATGEVELRTVTARKKTSVKEVIEKSSSGRRRRSRINMSNLNSDQPRVRKARPEGSLWRWCHKKMAELKVMQLDESVQKEEFTARVAEAVEYSIMNVRFTSTHNGVGDEHRLGEVPPGGGDEDGGKRKNPRRTVIAEDPTHTSETPPVLQVSAGRARNLAMSIRRNGTCVEDLTLVNVAARDAIASWEVLEEVESLSDHAYIKYEKNPQSSGGTDCLVNDRHSWRTWKLKTVN
ncbi:UNVERIFIED_CONTAM: hypothetical protein PYX00_008835 [Menopon gallinae]|uniref:Endonuclease/exonuclease/phosphatase domain-containing protein n=1 Tax=Menopon gallinae TaxID=328185 RepID=A0AAW2H976_9NEOP